jgi:hypothetical protein
MNVYVRSVDGADDARPVSEERERPVRAVRWAEDGRHLIYPQDTAGDENFHLLLVDADAGTATDLTPFPDTRAALLATAPARPDALLFQTNQRDTRLMDAYRLDLNTGERVLAGENPGDIVGWLADNQLARARCRRLDAGRGHARAVPGLGKRAVARADERALRRGGRAGRLRPGRRDAVPAQRREREHSAPVCRGICAAPPP